MVILLHGYTMAWLAYMYAVEDFNTTAACLLPLQT